MTRTNYLLIFENTRHVGKVERSNFPCKDKQIVSYIKFPADRVHKEYNGVPDNNPVRSFSCSPGNIIELLATVIPTISPSKLVLTTFISGGDETTDRTLVLMTYEFIK